MLIDLVLSKKIKIAFFVSKCRMYFYTFLHCLDLFKPIPFCMSILFPLKYENEYEQQIV